MQTRKWPLKFAWVLLGLWSCQTSKGEELNQHSAQESDVPALEAGVDSSSGETSSDDTSDASAPTPAPTQGACFFGSSSAGVGSPDSIRPTPLNCGEYHDSLPAPSLAAVDRYPCFDADLPGYESVYRFEPEFNAPLSGFIDPTPGIDVVLLLLEEDCDPARCVASLAIDDYGEWAMNYEVEAGKRYYLVVEGGTPAEPPVYAMSLDCE